MLCPLRSAARPERCRPHFDLRDLARALVDSRLQETQRCDVRIDATLAAAPATGDPSLVDSLVANLLDNAIRHNVHGGRVEITTTSTADGARLSISNTGPVVPAHELERLFQPFQRLGEHRVSDGNGHGLGLAVVQAIASAHAATLTARPRPEGGLDVQVAFNASPLGLGALAEKTFAGSLSRRWDDSDQ